MDKILPFLTGYRTYIICALVAITNVGVIAGWWTWDNAKVIDSILAPFGFAFLRAAVDKNGGTNTPN